MHEPCGLGHDFNAAICNGKHNKNVFFLLHDFVSPELV